MCQAISEGCSRFVSKTGFAGSQQRPEEHHVINPRNLLVTS